MCLLILLPALAKTATAQEQSPDPPATGDASDPVAETDDPITETDNFDDGWWFGFYGAVRAGYELVESDPDYDFIGQNNGFVLHHARLGVSGGNAHWGLGFKLSVEGASDLRDEVNSPQGDLDVRLRDAYVRLDDPWLGVVGLQAGQFQVPFNAEDMRSSSDLVFVSRAVGLEGVPAGRGLEESGIVVGRDLGIMVSSPSGIMVADDSFGVGYHLSLTNGNGPNQLLNDNNELAFVGRIELLWSDLIQLGGAYLINDRTIGELPNLFQENDAGWTADLLLTWQGLEVFGAFTQLSTEFPTVGTAAREQSAWHAQVTYLFDQICVPFAPAYRIAFFHPWAAGGVTEGGYDLDSYQLMYHTMGLRVWAPEAPVLANFNYTLTGEETARAVENNRFEALLQVIF